MSVNNTNTSFRDESKKLKRKKKRTISLSSEIGLLHKQGKPKRCRLNGQENTYGKVKSSVASLAAELQSKLDARYPSFVKPLLKSHVTGGFWLGLPAPFCLEHLPQKDTLITLETQSKNLYKAKYLVRKAGLSGGWRNFAISERLLVGDVLVLHLLSTTRFKVYIIRVDNLTDVEGALFLLKLDASMEQSVHGKLTKSNKGKELAEAVQKTMQPPDNSKGKISSKVADCFQTNETGLNSNAFTTFDDFCIAINKLLKDFELPQHIKLSYYNLCRSQNTLLHAHLPVWINRILISGIIMETVTIADSLRKSEISTFKDGYAVWDKTLNALELLGMNVGFLRERLLCLRKIAHDPTVDTFRKKCTELCSENAHAEEEIRSLMARLTEMKKDHRKRAADMADLKSKIRNHELKFQKQVQVPW